MVALNCLQRFSIRIVADLYVLTFRLNKDLFYYYLLLFKRLNRYYFYTLLYAGFLIQLPLFIGFQNYQLIFSFSATSS